MNLANTAPGRTPWPVPGSDGMAWTFEALSIQLSFDIAAPEPPSLTAAGITLAEPWLTEPRDTSRHGAELAALLVLLQAEAGFPPPLGEAAPDVLSLEVSSVLPLDVPPYLLLPPVPPPVMEALLDIACALPLPLAPMPPIPDWVLL